MIYKRLGRTGLEVSRLGFGAMRLPEKGDGKPDPEESIRIIHRAFEMGVNYIDTAVMYCHHQSESIVGQALKGWRDRVYVSTKNHYRGADEKAWWQNLENSLTRLDVAYIDVYNIHGINWKTWEQWVKGPNQILSWMRKAYDQGLIRHVCCSFHDTADALEKIVDTDEFSSITLQYNLLDRSLEGVFPKMAEKDIGLVVMGPVGGGRLGAESENLRSLMDGARSVPEVALRFVLANPHVTAAISGMSAMVHVEENCTVAARPEPLSKDEHERVVETLERFKGLADLYCTGCNYCMPCPHGVDIPGTFSTVNVARVYGLAEHAEARYKELVGKPTYCVACGACEAKCPQHIPIRVQLREAAARSDPDYGQVRLTIEPLDRNEDGVRLRARVHNVSDAPKRVSVRFSAGDDLQVEPDALEENVDDPFGVCEKYLVLRGARAGAGAIRIDADVEDGASRTAQSSVLMMGECRRVALMAALCAAAEETPPLSIDREDQVYKGREYLGRPYGMQVWTGYTPETLLVVARLQDGRDEQPAVQSNLALVLDLRNRHGNLPPGFHDAMFLLVAAVNAEGKPDVRVHRGELEAARVAIERVAVAGGVELRIAIPWDAVGGYAPDAGEAFGFDMVFSVADAESHPTFRAGWSGNPEVHRDAGKLGALFFSK